MQSFGHGEIHFEGVPSAGQGDGSLSARTRGNDVSVGADGEQVGGVVLVGHAIVAAQLKAAAVGVGRHAAELFHLALGQRGHVGGDDWLKRDDFAGRDGRRVVGYRGWRGRYEKC